MKQYLLYKCILFVCISVTFLTPNRSSGQLSGNYTINPTSAASSTNYTNWASAISDLISGSRNDGGTAIGPGVSGPVVFSVYDTLYDNTSISITAITGSSYSNTITFKSSKGDSSKCRLQYPSSSSTTDDYVVLLDDADYITFSKIGFERTGSDANATVIVINNDADNNKFINCQMTGLKIISATVFDVGVASCVYLLGNGDSTEIRGCRLLYGFNGVYTAIASTGIRITGNLIDTSGSAGIYMKNQTDLKLIGNTVNLGDFGSSAGQYTSYGFRIEASAPIDVSKNKIYSLAVNAQVSRSIVIISSVGTASAPLMVTNNFILNYGGNGSIAYGCNGLATYGCNYINFYYNNVLITNSVTDAAAYFHQTGFTSTFVNLKNNNFINKGGGYAIFVFGTDLDSVNFNNLYVTGNYLTSWNASNYNALSSWQTASGKDANSLNIDPGFVSNSNLHITSYALKGKAIPYFRVKDDIDGDIRDVNNPYIGADELLPVPDDAGIVALLKPVANTCAGILSVEAVIKNYGTAALKKAKVNWSVNGAAQTQVNWTGNLSTNQLDTFVLGTFNFTSTLNPKIIVKSNQPNDKNDVIFFNDSILLVRALRGPPTANLGANYNICLGDSTLIGPVNNPTNTYKWMTLSNTVLGTSSQIYIKPTTQTSYIMEVKSISFGCTNRDTITIGINSNPVADAGSDHTICLGDSVQLGKAPQSGFTYSWTSQPAGFSSTLANPNAAPSTTSNYTIQKTVTATGCKATDIATVVVNQPPVPKITGTKNVCLGDMMIYTTNANTGSSYRWTVTDGQLLSGQNTNTVDILWNNNGTGLLQVTETNAATCKDSSDYTVNISPKPTADFSFSETCKGSITNFTDLSTDALTYQWDFGDGGTSGVTSPTHMFLTVSAFPLRLIVANSFGCTDTAINQIIINPIPVANFGLVKTAEKTYSFSDSTTISSGTITKWRWEFGDGDTSGIQNPNHQFAAAGSFTGKLCVTSAAGCQNCFSKSFDVLNINQLSTADKLSIVPNPGSGIFTLTSLSLPKMVVISNLNGQVIEVLTPESNEFQLDLSGNPAGIYFINVISDKTNITQKLIKQ